MSEANKRYSTRIFIEPSKASEAEALLTTISRVDPSFLWEIKDVENEQGAMQPAVLIYSRYRNQADKRGNWLTRRTDIFKEAPYTVTLKPEKARPTNVESLIDREAP